ncbi:MAG TPA: glycoside hydrolase family 15 protein [Terriglobales bacterium]|nr:glycoside hydrolase family 15 protein [Terriglobales bacterium]
MYRPIADYAVIGDTHSAALIGSDGSLDWACLPHFNSGAVFLRLLDDEKGGYCAINPREVKARSRRYLPSTNILESTFITRSGTLQVIDFMPLRRRREPTHTGQDVDSDHQIIRLLRCTSGEVEVAPDVHPTFNFARDHATLQERNGTLVFCAENDELHVQGAPLRPEAADRASGHFPLRAGEATFISLRHARPGSAVTPADLAGVEALLSETREYWETWVRSCHYQGEYRDSVLRSALTAKLLTFEPSGAIVAAATTSLPEQVGGERNWDYRFTWVRDASFTLTALMVLGYYGEAGDFLHFLHRTCPNLDTSFQILYGIDGEHEQKEIELKQLKGYRDSRPVRVGNAAARQKQLDVYGELLQSVYLYVTHEAFAERRGSFTREIWSLVRQIADHVARVWRQPDSGLWEMRGQELQFVDSKALCWAALDRALKLADLIKGEADIALWKRERDAVYHSIMTNGFNAQLGAFVQSYGSEALDASALRLPIIGLIGASDPRMLSTIRRIEQRLLRKGLVYRYRGVNDGVSGEEKGTFAMCTFWLIDNYVLLERFREAEELFEHVLSFQNDVGLFSEEIDPDNGEQLGNFPQAFTTSRSSTLPPGWRPRARAISCGPMLWRKGAPKMPPELRVHVAGSAPGKFGQRLYQFPAQHVQRLLRCPPAHAFAVAGKFTLHHFRGLAI